MHAVRRPRPKFLLGSASLLVAGFLLAGYNAVDNVLTASDRAAFSRHFQGLPLQRSSPPESYDDELALIARVQRAVLDHVPGREGLALGEPREPAHVLEAGTGKCYDRSRVIEKLLRSAGFETRHVAVYSTVETGSALLALLTPGVPSHALTEVRTSEGWLMVDSNEPWLSVDAAGAPVEAAAVQADVEGRAIDWHPGWKEHMNEILRRPFIYVYGLYSRHGRFYPPFNPVPDIHYGEFADNFF